jgi:hypothetical protein
MTPKDFIATSMLSFPSFYISSTFLNIMPRLSPLDRLAQIARTSGLTSPGLPLDGGCDDFVALSRSQAGYRLTFSAFRSRTIPEKRMWQFY